jgi:hypothetical protein
MYRGKIENSTISDLILTDGTLAFYKWNYVLITELDSARSGLDKMSLVLDAFGFSNLSVTPTSILVSWNDFIKTCKEFPLLNGFDEIWLILLPENLTIGNDEYESPPLRVFEAVQLPANSPKLTLLAEWMHRYQVQLGCSDGIMFEFVAVNDEVYKAIREHPPYLNV